jgi:hypothetical protein
MLARMKAHTHWLTASSLKTCLSSSTIHISSKARAQTSVCTFDHTYTHSPHTQLFTNTHIRTCTRSSVKSFRHSTRPINRCKVRRVHYQVWFSTGSRAAGSSRLASDWTRLLAVDALSRCRSMQPRAGNIRTYLVGIVPHRSPQIPGHRVLGHSCMPSVRHCPPLVVHPHITCRVQARRLSAAGAQQHCLHVQQVPKQHQTDVSSGDAVTALGARAQHVSQFQFQSGQFGRAKIPL